MKKRGTNRWTPSGGSAAWTFRNFTCRRWVIGGVRSDEERDLNPYQFSQRTVENDSVHVSMRYLPSFLWTMAAFALPSVASRVCIPLGCVGSEYAFRLSSMAWQWGSFGSILIAAIAFAWFANRIAFHNHIRWLCVLIATTFMALIPIVLYLGQLPNENFFLVVSVFTVLLQAVVLAYFTRKNGIGMIRVAFLAMVVYGLGCAIGAIDVIVVALADP
jgi:hypothetical protein